MQSKHEEQPLPQGLGEEVVPFLIKKLEERRALGISRYGEPLTTFNGRDQDRDALEELIDFVQYFSAGYLERGAAEGTLGEIKGKMAEKVSKLEAENTYLKEQVVLARAAVKELNEKILGLTSTLGEGFKAANLAIDTLALRCATNLLLDT